MDTLFLQFYHKRKTSINKEIICYNNGFSETWDLCKQHGDFYWLEYKINSDYLTNIDHFKDTELPISKGTIYVSCFYITQLWWIVILARKYSDIKFIVGGPVNGWVGELPANVITTDKTMEEVFGVKPFSYKWKLELPVAEKNSLLHFTYPIEDRCYWSKCIFCTYSTNTHRIRSCPKWEFEYIESNMKKIVFIYSPSISPNYLKILPEQPDQENIEYAYFIRADVSETLKTILPKLSRPDNHMFACGMDFPSDRMLSYINKGLTKKDYIKLAKVFSGYDCTLLFTMILGWPNLIENDIKEAENFINELKLVNPKVMFKINKLISKPEKILRDFKIGNKYKIGDFYCGFYPYLSSKQKKLNKKVLQKIKLFDNVNDCYTGMVKKAL